MVTLISCLIWQIISIILYIWFMITDIYFFPIFGNLHWYKSLTSLSQLRCKFHFSIFDKMNYAKECKVVSVSHLLKELNKNYLRCIQGFRKFIKISKHTATLSMFLLYVSDAYICDYNWTKCLELFSINIWYERKI